MTNAILLHRTMQAVLTFAGCVALTGGVLAEPAAEARQPKGHLRLDRSKLLIGTWWLEPQFQDEAHVRDMADCGIEFLTGAEIKPEALDYFAKYGVGVVQKYYFPFWWAGWGKNGQMATLNPISKYAERLKTFRDYPAIVGFDLGDEPSSLDFDHFGRVAAYVARQLPDKFVFVNLFLNYAAKASLTREEALTQLGTRDYTTYIRKYCKAFFARLPEF